MPFVTNWRAILLLTASLAISFSERAGAEPPDSKTQVRTDAYGDPLPPGAIARLGTIRLRHGGHQIRSVAFSPDGKVLASGAADNLVKFWDPATGKELAILKGHTDVVWSVVFSPNGKTLASGSADKTTKLWDLSHWQPGGAMPPVLTLTGHEEPIRCVAFSPDGKMLASASEDATVKLWDLSAWRGSMARANVPVSILKGRGGRVYSVSFSPDGKTLASASDDKTVKLWDVSTRKEKVTLRGHNHSIAAVAFSPNGKWLALADLAGALKLWDLNQGGKERLNPPSITINAHDSWIFTLAFSPDSKTLASGGLYGKVKIWDLNNWRPSTGAPSFRTLEGNHNLHSVAFSPDGKMLASGGSVVKLWNIAIGKEIVVPKLQPDMEIKAKIGLEGAHAGEVRAVAFTPDGRTVATGGSTDSTIRFWHLPESSSDATTPTVISLTRQTENFFCFAFNPDGKSLASGGVGGNLSIWDIPSGAERTTLQAAVRGFQSLAYSPDGRTLAAASFEGPIRFWDLQSGKEKETLVGPPNFSFAAFSVDGTRIAAAAGDGTVKLWDVASGREWASLTHGEEWTYSLAFSPDGKTLAAGNGDDEVLLWDVVAAKFIGALKGHREMVRSVVFSPDGKTLASAGEDSVVKLWDLTKCRSGVFSRQPKNNSNVWYRNRPERNAHATLVHDFAGHLASVTGVAFSPDGTMLASSSRDTTALLWDVANLRTKQNKEEPALAADAITSCWNDLAGENAAKAYEAIWTLASTPKQSVPFIREHLRLATAPDPKRMDRLVADLDSNNYSGRKNAGEELEKLQDLAGPVLRRQLKKQLSLEVRRRLEQLLEKIDGPVTAPEQLRGLRAIEVLEHIGTPQAREILQSLGKGAPEARLTQEAKASLGRVEKRAGVRP